MNNLKKVNGGATNTETIKYDIGDYVYVADNAYDNNNKKKIKGGAGTIVSRKPRGIDFRNHYNYDVEIKRESGNVETVLVYETYITKI